MPGSSSGGGALIFTAPGPRRGKRPLRSKGRARSSALPAAGAGLDLERVLAELGKREIASLLVEGGSRVFTSFIEAGLADKILLFVSPLLIGGAKAPFRSSREPGAASIRTRSALRERRCFPVGGDRMIEGYF